MKDEITVGLNGKTIASIGIELKGRTIDVAKVASFVVSTGSDNDKDVMNIRMGCILVNEVMAPVEEKKVVPIEPMVSPVELSKPVVPVTPVETPTPTPTYNEIPIKPRKPRGPNKQKGEAVEESVFDRPKENIVKVAEEIEKKGEFVSLEEAAKELKIAPTVEVIVEGKNGPVVEKVNLPIAPTVAIPTTPARINELAKLVKMWCKASGLDIGYVTVDRLKAEAFDIVENDSDVTIEAGIKEAARLIKG